jgi:ribosomal protein L37E
MRSRSISAILILLISILVIEAEAVDAYNYNESVSENIPFGSAWTAQMQLDRGQTVRIDLSSNGFVDFYFMDSSGYSQFEAAANNGGQGQFSYFPALSQLGSSSIYKTAQVPANGTYYVVVPNMDNLNTIQLSGRITATSGGLSDLALIDPTLLLIIVVVVLVLIILVVLVYRQRREDDTSREGREPFSTSTANLQSPSGSSGPKDFNFCPKCGRQVYGMLATFCPSCGSYLLAPDPRRNGIQFEKRRMFRRLRDQ